MKRAWVPAAILAGLAVVAFPLLFPRAMGAPVQLQPQVVIPADASYLYFGRDAVPEFPGEAVHTRLDGVLCKERPPRAGIDTNMLIVMMSDADCHKLNLWAKYTPDVAFRVSRDRKTVTIVNFNAWHHEQYVNGGKPDYIVLAFVSAEHWGK